MAILGQARPARPPGMGRPWRALALLLASALSLAVRARAAEVAPEYQLKAVFLFNFTQFVTWPPSAFAGTEAPLVIGIVGDDPFGDTLDATVKDEKSRGHPLLVRRFRHGETIAGCHVLFISKSEAANLPAILAAVHNQTVLTVGDMDDFARRGGMVRFMTVNHKLRLRINLEAARSAGLELSSKLLRPADVVAPGDN